MFSWEPASFETRTFLNRWVLKNSFLWLLKALLNIYLLFFFTSPVEWCSSTGYGISVSCRFGFKFILFFPSKILKLLLSNIARTWYFKFILSLKLQTLKSRGDLTNSLFFKKRMAVAVSLCHETSKMDYMHVIKWSICARDSEWANC